MSERISCRHETAGSGRDGVADRLSSAAGLQVDDVECGNGEVAPGRNLADEQKIVSRQSFGCECPTCSGIDQASAGLVAADETRRGKVGNQFGTLFEVRR